MDNIYKSKRNYFFQNSMERISNNHHSINDVYYQINEDMNNLFEKFSVIFNCGMEIEIMISDSLNMPGSNFKMLACLHRNNQQYQCKYKLIDGLIRPNGPGLRDYLVKNGCIEADKKMELCEKIIRDKSKIIKRQQH